MTPKVTNIDKVIYEEDIKKAEQVLIDNGIDADEADVVLQALGYVLLDEELYWNDDEEDDE